MDTKVKIKAPGIKLEPKKEIVEKLPKADRLAYVVIFALLAFVFAVLFLIQIKEFDANFWIVIVVIIAVSFIFCIQMLSRDKNTAKKEKLSKK